MRFRVDRFDSARLWLAIRAAGLSIFGCGGVVVASFVTLMGVILVVTAEETGLHRLAPYVVLTIFAGLVPLGLTALALWRGIARWQALGRLRGMAAVASRRASLSSQDVAEGLGVSSDQAERAVLEAAEAGLVEDEQADLAPVVSTSGVRRSRLSRPLGDPAACVGATLNDTYRLEAHLGAGAMGTVYAARHVRTGRAYAVKMILPDARASAELLRRFEREATAAGALGHPNIVAVHDYDRTEDGVPYLVMDLLRGETLERRLEREGSLPFAEARRVTLDLAAALDAAHAAGLLHRDLKPANVFLVEDGGAPVGHPRSAPLGSAAQPPAPPYPPDPPRATPRAVLLDFGLVKRLDEAATSRLTSTGAAVGTPLYMSPEQARGEPLDVRSDVYGLGALLYEMTTGAPPFADRALADVYARLLTEPAPPPSSLGPVPADLDPLLDRALAKRRDDRFADVRAFAEALTRIAERAA